MSLNWDQTQVSVRRAQAELLLSGGSVDNGLAAVEEVLRWKPFDLKTYEWAQSIVWDAAEAQRRMQPDKAKMLYLWVEGVPQRIEGRVTMLTPTERLLWRGYPEFLPSPHIRLIAEYARQRLPPAVK